MEEQEGKDGKKSESEANKEENSTYGALDDDK
jgi:hypothetical protein